MQCDGLVESILADIAPRTNSVGYDVNLVFSHFAESRAESQDGWLFEFSIMFV